MNDYDFIRMKSLKAFQKIIDHEIDIKAAKKMGLTESQAKELVIMYNNIANKAKKVQTLMYTLINLVEQSENKEQLFEILLTFQQNNATNEVFHKDKKFDEETKELRTLHNAIFSCIEEMNSITASVKEFIQSLGKTATNDLNIVNTCFFAMLQSQAINAISKTKTKNLVSQLNLLGDAEIKVSETFTLRIKDYQSLASGIPTTAYMLLDCFIIHFTKYPNKEARVRLPLKEYMEMRNLKDPKSTREQVVRDIRALTRIEYEAKEKIRGKWKYSGSVAIYGGTGYIENGIIHFNFNMDFYEALMNCRVMEYSKETLRLNPKQHPHAYYFSRYLDENYRINEGKDRVNTITIPTLLTKSPLLPTYEEVMTQHQGAIYRHIIEPVIRDLDIIDRLYYDFITADGETIENPLDFFKGENGYSKFITSKLQIDYSDYKQHTKRIEQRKKHATKVKKDRQTQTKISKLEKRINDIENKAND